jgi:hypothetical protein
MRIGRRVLCRRAQSAGIEVVPHRAEAAHRALTEAKRARLLTEEEAA